MRNLKRALSLALAFVMVMSLMIVGTSAKSYTDADKIDNQVAVEILGEIGVMIGNDDGSFAPDRDVTRAEMAVIITRILYGNNMNVDQFKNMNTFTDVPDWAEGFVNLCASLDIIAGRGNGIFDPDATVTTAEAALMLSRALGYFKNNAEFGNDWALAAMKRATQAGIIGGDMVLQANAGLDRDDVAQMTFNTLTKAVPVQYNEVLDVYYNENQGVIYALEFNYLQTLGYKNFSLVYKSNQQVEYGRPATTWGIGSYKDAGNGTASGIEKADLTPAGGLIAENVRMLAKDEIITVNNTPTYVYTQDTDAKDVYADLGADVCTEYSWWNKDGYEWTAFINGEEQDDVSVPTKNDGDQYTYTAKGAVTEVYVDDYSATVTVVEINYYLGQVYSVKDGTTTIRTLSNGGKILDDRTFATEEFAEDDYVVFTVDYNDDNDFYICEMMAPETVSGEVVRVENDKNSDDTYIRLDSKTGDKIYYTAGGHMVYDVNNANVGNHPTLNEEYILYMTPAGYILGFELANEKVPEYLYVKDSDEEAFDWIAKVILPDATQPTVDLKSQYKNGDNKVDIDWVPGGFKDSNIDKLIWDYSVNSDDVYSLTYVPRLENMSNGDPGDAGITVRSHLYQDRNDNGLWIRSGKSFVNSVLDRTAFVVDENTVFVDNVNHKSYTGYNEVPTIYAEDVAYVVEDGVAQIVFILEGEVYDENMTYFFLTDTSKGTWETEKDNDGNDYRVYECSYVDGSKQELTIAYDALKNDFFGASIRPGVLYRATQSFEEDGTRYITEVDVVAVVDPSSSRFNAFKAVAVGNNAFNIWNDANWNSYTTNSDTTYVLVEREPVDGKAYEAAVANGTAYTNFKWTVTPGRLSNLDDKLYYSNAETFATVAKSTNQVAELVYIYHITPDAGTAQRTVTVKDNQGFNKTYYVANGSNAVINYTAPEGYHVASVNNGATYDYANKQIVLKNVTSNVDLTVTLAKNVFIPVKVVFASEAQVNYYGRTIIEDETLNLVEDAGYTITVKFANGGTGKVLYGGKVLPVYGDNEYSFTAAKGADLLIVPESNSVKVATDSSTLNNAISNGADTIYLAENEAGYQLSDSKISSDVTLVGDGNVVLKGNKSSSNEPNTIALDVREGATLKVSGVVFDDAFNGIVTLGSGKVEIENCVFNVTNMGVYVGQGTPGGYIKNCIFNMEAGSYVAIGAYGLTGDLEISGNTFNGTGSHGYDIETFANNGTHLKVTDATMNPLV